MEQPNPCAEHPTLKFKNFVREKSGAFRAVYSNESGVEFDVTPANQDGGRRPYLDLVSHIRRQQAFSFRTFGPLGEGQRPEGVIAHIEKELREIKVDPNELGEWIDVAILAFDGMIKAGHSPEAIVRALVEKQTRNEARTWPDWRTAARDQAFEHVRTPEEARAKELELQAGFSFDANDSPTEE